MTPLATNFGYPIFSKREARGVTDLRNLGSLVDRWRGARILCVGDLMLDRFVYGGVERISPEAPIPVLRIQRESLMLGGAGNVVRNIAAVNAVSVFVSVIGDDEAGRRVSALLAPEANAAPHLLMERNRATTEKTRFIAGSHQMLRVDLETTQPIIEATARNLLSICAAQLAGCALLVLSDYGKGVLTPELAENLIAAARAAGKPVIVDPKGRDYRHYRGATLITPNRSELHAATSMPVGSDEQIVAAARRLIETCGVDNVLVTRSEDGMTLVAGDGAAEHIGAAAREVFDVSGAGDTVIAILACGLAAGASLSAAARLANVAAGLVVGKVGTAVVHVEELLGELLEEQSERDHGKVMGLSDALELVDRWRRAGRKIGFTNGCFDLLHPGHVSLLSQARRTCDRLVVGLNADSSVRRLKGPERPVQNELARAAVLASLVPVDLVVLFSEDTPAKLIEAVKPDVLVKGADYTVENVVGADFVQSYGGEVMLAELIPEQSTTRLVRRMRREDEK